ncbi:MAG TPA: hypothetical protein VGJ60_35720 [Chloroflexota bacterium]|jgi:hypothetical protein
MSTDDAPPVVWVPTDKIEVSYTLHDVLSKAVQEASGRASVAPDPSATTDPHLAELLGKMNDLLAQLNDVMAQINQIDPSVLGAKKDA